MASSQEEEIQHLRSLGLTLNQARVYAALAKFHNATARTLSNVSQLATCDIYRVIPELQELGLLEVVLCSPKVFKATEPEEAVKILLKQKVREIEEMQTIAKEFLTEINQIKSSEQANLDKIALIQCGERVEHFEKLKLLNTKKQLDVVQTNAVFFRFIAETSEYIEKLLKRKVKVRYLLEDKKAIEKADNEMKKIFEKPYFEVRFTKKAVAACIILHDNTEALISTSLDTLHAPSYWSSNPCIVSVVKGFFELEWREAAN